MKRFHGPIAFLTALFLAATLASNGAPLMACGEITLVDDDGYWIPSENGSEISALSESFWTATDVEITRFLTGSRHDRQEIAEDGYLLFGFRILQYQNSSEIQTRLLKRAMLIERWIHAEQDDWSVALLLRMLSDTNVRPLIPVFRSALDHPAGGVRAAAFRWFSNVRDPEVVDRLEELWADVDDWDRAGLMSALVRQGSDRHIDDFVDLACGGDAGEDIELRSIAVEAIARSTSEKAIPCLVALAQLEPDDEEDSSVINHLRQEAIYGLGAHKGNARAGDVLRKLLERPNDVRTIALEVVIEEGWSEAVPWLRTIAADPYEEPGFRLQILGSLGVLGEEHIPLMFEFLDDQRLRTSFDALITAINLLQENGVIVELDSVDRWARVTTTWFGRPDQVEATYQVLSSPDSSGEPCFEFPGAYEGTILDEEEVDVLDNFAGNGDHWAQVEVDRLDDYCWVRFDALLPLD